MANNNQEGIYYTEYDLSDIIKDDINSIFKQNMDIINITINEIKGDKFDVDLYKFEPFDFEDTGIFERIGKDFESFIKTKKRY